MIRPSLVKTEILQREMTIKMVKSKSEIEEKHKEAIEQGLAKPEEIEEAKKETPPKVAVLFSGGIDSTFALIRTCKTRPKSTEVIPLLTGDENKEAVKYVLSMITDRELQPSSVNGSSFNGIKEWAVANDVNEVIIPINYEESQQLASASYTKFLEASSPAVSITSPYSGVNKSEMIKELANVEGIELGRLSPGPKSGVGATIRNKAFSEAVIPDPHANQSESK